MFEFIKIVIGGYEMKGLKYPITTLEHAFMSMCYVARHEGIDLSEDQELLFDAITTLNDYDTSDMMANMDVIENILNQEAEIKEYIEDMK